MHVAADTGLRRSVVIDDEVVVFLGFVTVFADFGSTIWRAETRAQPQRGRTRASVNGDEPFRRPPYGQGWLPGRWAADLLKHTSFTQTSHSGPVRAHPL